MPKAPRRGSGWPCHSVVPERVGLTKVDEGPDEGLKAMIKDGMRLVNMVLQYVIHQRGAEMLRLYERKVISWENRETKTEARSAYLQTWK